MILKICGYSAAMRDFAKAQDQWYSTWPQTLADRAMIVYAFSCQYFYLPRLIDGFLGREQRLCQNVAIVLS